MSLSGNGPPGGLQALTDAALAHLDLDALLRGLLERTKELVQADTCAFLLLDPDRDEIVATAALGIEEEVEQGVRIPVGRGFAGRVAAECRPIVLQDVDSADIFNPILREKGIKSLLGVPLMTDNQLLGVLHVGTLTPRDSTATTANVSSLPPTGPQSRSLTPACSRQNETPVDSLKRSSRSPTSPERTDAR